VNSAGNVIAQLAAFREDERVVDMDSSPAIEFHEGQIPEQIFRRAFSSGSAITAANAPSTRVVVGLSGGIDSAVYRSHRS